MLLKADIRFERSSCADGFGFTCMRTAYSMEITGRMDYDLKGVKIIAEGEQEKINEFIRWIQSNIRESGNLQCNTTCVEVGKFREFDIYRHTA